MVSDMRLKSIAWLFCLFWLFKTELAAKEIAWQQLHTVCQYPTHVQQKKLTELRGLLPLSPAREDCQALLAQLQALAPHSSAHQIARQLLSAKPPLLLAKTWQPGMDIHNWWMSEKLDGVRAYWNGRELVSRGGNRFHAPAWFTKNLPAMPLDGELWIGRGQFEKTVSIVRSHKALEEWRKIRYFIFDAPGVPGPFEARLAFLEQEIPKLNLSHIQLVKHRQIKNKHDFQSEFEKIIAHNGEGLMLRQPGSLYEGRRSATLLKVKPYQDAEAEVIGHQPGKGKLKGRMGALLVRLADGTEFKIGTGFTDQQRQHPPALRETIVFKHYGYTRKGKPRFPVYLRIHRAL